jgi:hypothetical protein
MCQTQKRPACADLNENFSNKKKNYALAAAAALAIAAKLLASRDAPPTRAPSMSGCEK